MKIKHLAKISLSLIKVHEILFWGPRERFYPLKCVPIIK